MNSEVYNLTVEAVGPMREFTAICVANGFDEIVAEGYHRVQKTLPKGIYTVTTTLNDQISETIVRLTENKVLRIDSPDASSSIVVDGLESTPQYYLEFSRRYSRETTVVHNRQPSGTSLYILFRYANRDAFQKFNQEGKNIGEGFFLLNSDRKVIHRLHESCGVWDQHSGCLAFHTTLEKGIYFLTYKGTKLKGKVFHQFHQPREIPLIIYEGFQSKVFMLFDQCPNFSSLRISMSRKGQDQDLRNSSIIEAAIQKFYNGINYFPFEVLEELAGQKWQDPFTALIASYMYYTGRKHEHDRFFDTCLDNLQVLLGEGSPELKALFVLRALHNGEELPQLEFYEPCMFLAGLRKVIRMSVQHKQIKVFGVAEKIIENLYTDLLWTSYKPLPVKREKRRHEASLKVQVAKSPSFMARLPNVAEVSHKMKGENVGVKRVGKPHVLNSWVANSIIELAAGDPESDLDSLASKLNVTPNLVEKTINVLIDKKDKILAYQQQKGEDLLPKDLNLERFIDFK